jgi:hypothetical protein
MRETGETGDLETMKKVVAIYEDFTRANPHRVLS